VDYLLYMLVGAIAGTLSGLLGLGGGIVVVPALIFVFTIHGLSAEIITHLAIGTSLATIAVTSFASTVTHHQKKILRWDIVRWIVPGLIVGSVLGGLVAASLSGPFLQLCFGGLMILVAMQLFVRLKASVLSVPGRRRLGGAGVVIGALSTLFGIGGGTLSTPFLAASGTNIRQAMAVAAACGVPIAIVGGLTYFFSGLHQESLPEGSLGYIFIPAWLGIVLTSIPFASLGALFAHRLPERLLKQLFAGILFILGARFIWLNTIITFG
jgi:uncharacterized membrane protein YfcA